MSNLLQPFYDPSLSYEENYIKGPFGLFKKKNKNKINHLNTKFKFLNLPVNLPFGIPAGPLVNANFVTAALDYEFDLCVYKTVRTKKHKSHPLPNILSVHVNSKLTHQIETVFADNNFTQPISITNSFGVPSFDPEVWQHDLQKAVNHCREGQYVIGSFQGTHGNENKIEKDYAIAAKLINETNCKILEANLSCPNEGTNKLLCFDIEKVEVIAKEIKNAVPDKPLILKLAFFEDDQKLLNLLKKLNGTVDAFSVINTISAMPIDKQGKPALSEDRKVAGVCGDAIRWAGLAMVKKLNTLKTLNEFNFSIIGVGGVNQKEHYYEYLKSGADAVMSATGAMWNPLLAIEIKNE